MDEHTNDRVSSLRQRDRSLEKDRLHVRFDEARGAFKEQRSSDSYSENVQERESQSSNRKQYSLKLQLDHSESEIERKKLNSIDQESNDDKSYSSHLSSLSARVDANSLQNHRLLSRPDTHVGSNKIRPSSEEKNDLASDSALRDDTNDEKENNDTQEDAADDGEVSNDDFNEKLASLDENSRKYYHFFHLLDGVQAGCSVKTRKGTAGDVPPQDSFPMFKSAKYWISVHWGVSLPMDTWAICFYTDHWSAHHGPKSALRTLPLSEISEVYLEPKTNAYFRIYRGKEVTQCTPTATTLASALWADAIFAVLQLHNDHDIKIIKDHFQGYQAFVHANRNGDDKGGELLVSTGPRRTKRPSIFDKMKEIFSSTSGETIAQQEGASITLPTNRNSSGVYSASERIMSTEVGQQNSNGRSSRAIRRWTVVGGTFLNQSNTSDDASATAGTVTEKFSSKSLNKSGQDHEILSSSSMLFSSLPNRRAASSRRDSRSQSNENFPRGVLSQSVTGFHKPESSSPLRKRLSISSSGDERRRQQFEEAKWGDREVDETRSRCTDSTRSKHISIDSVDSSALPNAASTADFGRGEGVLASVNIDHAKQQSSAGQSLHTVDHTVVSSTNPATTMPEPRSIHERLRAVAAYSSGDERKMWNKNSKQIQKRGQSDTSGYFSDTYQIKHGDKPPVASHAFSSHPSLEERTEAGEQITGVVRVPRPPAAELGQFTVLDMLYAQNLAVKQRQLAQERTDNNLKKKNDSVHTVDEKEEDEEEEIEEEREDKDESSNRRIINISRKSPSRHFELSSFSPQRHRMASPSKPEALYTTYVNSSSSRAKESPSKKHRETLLTEFLNGDVSRPFSVFSKLKEFSAVATSSGRNRGAGLQGLQCFSSQLDDHTETPSAKHQKGYLARAFSGNIRGPTTKSSNSKDSLASIFRYSQDHSSSATADCEDGTLQVLQNSKGLNSNSSRTFLAMKKSKTQSSQPDIILTVESSTPSVQERLDPTRSNSGKKKSNQLLSSTSTEAESQQDPRPLEFRDLSVENVVEGENDNWKEKAQQEDRDSTFSSFSHKRRTVPPPPSLPPTASISNTDDDGDVTSPPAPEHMLFKTYSPQFASPTLSQITPSKIRLPGVASPLIGVDSRGIQGMFSQLEQMRERYVRSPVHHKISLEQGTVPITTDETKELQNSVRFSPSSHDSSHSKIPSQDTIAPTPLQLLVPRESASLTSCIPFQRAFGTSHNRDISPLNQRPSAGSSIVASSRVSSIGRVGRHYNTGSMLSVSELKTLCTTNANHNLHNNPGTQSKVSSGFPFPFSATMPATLAGHVVTVTLLSRSELRQKLLSRPNLIPMRPGLQLSPIKHRPIQPSSGLLSSHPLSSSSLALSPSALMQPGDSAQDIINQTTSPALGATVQAARQKYLREQQQERESLEVTAITMIAIAAELLDAEYYLGISRISNILTTTIQNAHSHRGSESHSSESLRRDIVEEYVYIPMGRIMTLDIDESRSGLFRFSLSSMNWLLRAEAAVRNGEEARKKKGLSDACLFLRSFDLIPSESILLSQFSAVLGVSPPVPVGVTTEESLSPPAAAIDGSHSWRRSTSSVEVTGSSSVGQRYNQDRVPQVKDPKRKVSAQQQQQESQNLFTMSSPTVASAQDSADYVSYVLKANSPEILPAFLQTLVHLRQTVTL